MFPPGTSKKFASENVSKPKKQAGIRFQSHPWLSPAPNSTVKITWRVKLSPNLCGFRLRLQDQEAKDGDSVLVWGVGHWPVFEKNPCLLDMPKVIKVCHLKMPWCKGNPLPDVVMNWWWFQTSFNFYPETWRNDPIRLAHIFQMGWFNHQLVMIASFWIRPTGWSGLAGPMKKSLQKRPGEFRNSRLITKNFVRYST